MSKSLFASWNDSQDVHIPQHSFHKFTLITSTISFRWIKSIFGKFTFVTHSTSFCDETKKCNDEKRNWRKTSTPTRPLPLVLSGYYNWNVLQRQKSIFNFFMQILQWKIFKIKWKNYSFFRTLPSTSTTHNFMGEKAGNFPFLEEEKSKFFTWNFPFSSSLVDVKEKKKKWRKFDFIVEICFNFHQTTTMRLSHYIHFSFHLMMEEKKKKWKFANAIRVVNKFLSLSLSLTPRFITFLSQY